MKNLLFLSFLLGVIVTSSCAHHHHHHYSKSKVPPGHAKKIAGTQSAKPYAPGQQKKH